MGDKMSRKSVPFEKPAPAVTDEKVAETPMEAVSSICAVLVVGSFILTFLKKCTSFRFNECFGLWMFKNSVSVQTAPNPVIDNVYSDRENRLWGILAR
jgi:hypothetical protein